MKVKSQVFVFCFVTPCSAVVTYQGPPKRWYTTTSLHDVRTQKTSTWILITVSRCT